MYAERCYLVHGGFDDMTAQQIWESLQDIEAQLRSYIDNKSWSGGKSCGGIGKIVGSQCYARYKLAQRCNSIDYECVCVCVCVCVYALSARIKIGVDGMLSS
jgi:hypothetical protein